MSVSQSVVNGNDVPLLTLTARSVDEWREYE